MSDHCDVLLFGDLTGDFATGLRFLLGDKENALLVTFFERAAHSLRAEIGGLSAQKRALFPSFTTLSELLVKLKTASQVNPALEKALTCIHQFGCFIRYVMSNAAFPFVR